MDIPLFLCLGCFQFGSLINQAAMDMHRVFCGQMLKLLLGKHLVPFVNLCIANIFP